MGNLFNYGDDRLTKEEIVYLLKKQKELFEEECHKIDKYLEQLGCAPQPKDELSLIDGKSFRHTSDLDVYLRDLGWEHLNSFQYKKGYDVVDIVSDKGDWVIKAQ